MDKIIKNILKKIEDEGYKAYLVGGYVRDYLLGIDTYDVDICTNALPKDLHNLFPSNSNSNNYGGFNLKIKRYNIDITTFRKELKYNNRKPSEMIYIDSLEEDILRRDFTINSICMDRLGNIIDPLNGVNDLNNQVIKMNGDIDKRLEEDPLRILRAIRFASNLNFTINEYLYDSIKRNYKLVSKLSNTRIKNELNKILLNKNYKRGLSLLEEFNILELLNISYNEINYVNDICGMWAQLDFNDSLTFTKQELINIINIKEIIKKGNIDNLVLYKYGLYNSLVAAEILNINKKDINKLYNKLSLKSEEYLDITNKEIIDILNIKPSSIIKDIKRDVIESILLGRLKNKNSEIKKYIINRKEMYL